MLLHRIMTSSGVSSDLSSDISIRSFILLYLPLRRICRHRRSPFRFFLSDLFRLPFTFYILYHFSGFVNTFSVSGKKYALSCSYGAPKIQAPWLISHIAQKKTPRCLLRWLTLNCQCVILYRGTEAYILKTYTDKHGKGETLWFR